MAKIVFAIHVLPGHQPKIGKPVYREDYPEQSILGFSISVPLNKKSILKKLSTLRKQDVDIGTFDVYDDNGDLIYNDQDFDY